MNNYVKIKMPAALAVLCLTLTILFSGPAFGQQDALQNENPELKEDYTDNELKEFINANQEATRVQQQAEQRMVSAIEEEGLDIDTFNKILSSQREQGQQAGTSDPELEKFHKAAEKVLEIQQETMADMQEAIVESGMEVVKFQEMMTAFQQSPDLQQKVQKILDEQQ